MKRKQIVAALVCAVALMAAGAARADDVVYAAGPGGGFGANYPVPVLLVVQGQGATFVNADIALHDVRARAIGPDSTWCKQFPFSYPNGSCPLFASPLIGLGGATRVRGVELLTVPAGQTSVSYPFVCSIHAWMQGTLIVVNP